MKERLLILYKLNRVDKELNELHSLKGDIPDKIEEITKQKNELENELNELNTMINDFTEGEQTILDEIKSITKKIDKNDIMLREGNVKSNEEYNALAREIDDGYEKIQKNEQVLEKDFKGKKDGISAKIKEVQAKLEELNTELVQNNEALEELNKQTREEEDDLNKIREELVSQISTEDHEFYDRINKVRFGEAVAIVRKNSCLGCYSSIPPQRAIEIRTSDKFFNCENCGRILIAEEIIAEQ